jgi:concanavalin A-like lectin/glucanase superfamily protein
MKLSFKDRFAPITAVKPLPAVAADKVVIPGTLAYWRFEGQGGMPVPEGGVAVRDLSGHGNDLTRVTLPNGTLNDMTYTREFHPAQPSRGSLFINGSNQNPSQGGAYLRTADGAPLNAETFKNGYTFEAFVRLPEDCCGDKHGWMGMLSRMGTGLDLGRTGQEDPEQPLVTLTMSPSREFQWAVAPFTNADLVTNWSFRTPALNWYHVALVNNGKTTDMYINGSKDVRNSHNLSVGLQTIGDFWLVGATHYSHSVGQSFYGWMGDVRITNRPLSVREFMISR